MFYTLSIYNFKSSCYLVIKISLAFYNVIFIYHIIREQGQRFCSIGTTKDFDIERSVRLILSLYQNELQIFLSSIKY